MTAELLTAAMLILATPATPAQADDVRALSAACIEHGPKHGESPWTLCALALKESRARLDVVGKLGECGAMQTMPWYLRPPMTCADLRGPNGSTIAAVRALDQWQAWLDARGLRRVSRYDCYASGNICARMNRPGRGHRMLKLWEMRLRATAAGLMASRAVGGDDAGP